VRRPPHTAMYYPPSTPVFSLLGAQYAMHVTFDRSVVWLARDIHTAYLLSLLRENRINVSRKTA